MIDFVINERLKNILKIFLVFSFFLSLFLYLQFSSFNLISPDDGFYHIKHAFLYRTDGISADFPYLEYTTLKEKPTDLWFFYHILLIPFTFFPSGQGPQIDMIFGLKAATAMFAALAFTAFYFILSRLNIKYSIAWTFALLVVFFSFSFRVLSPRPHVLSIFLLLLGIYFLIKEKKWHLFVLSAVYSLSYEVSFLMPVFSLVYALCYRIYFKKWNFELFLYSLGGWLLGVLLHPHPLNFIYGLYAVVFKEMFLRIFFNILDSGTEMYQRVGLYRDFALMSFLFGLAIVNYAVARLKKKAISFLEFYLLLIFSFLFALYIFMSRIIEYIAPIGLLFLAVIVDRWSILFSDAAIKIKNVLIKLRLDAYLFLIIGGVLGYFFYGYLSSALPQFKKHPYDNYRLISQWLINNTSDGEIIFNVNWDDFPQLFFWNTKNHYVTGIGSILMYMDDERKYWLWRNISHRGIACGSKECSEGEMDVYDAIKNEFNSRYIVVNNKKINQRNGYFELSSDKDTVNREFGFDGNIPKSTHQKLIAVLDGDKRFEKVYDDASFDGLVVYRLNQ